MADVNEFLNNISQIESNGGRNVNHPVMQSGMHKGMSAIGRYGMMPYTVQDIARQSPNPQIQQLAQVPPEQLKPLLESHPNIEQHVAQILANQVLTKTGGDDVKAAYMWNQGHNLDPNKIDDNKLMSSDYTQKYFKASGKPSFISTNDSSIAAASPQIKEDDANNRPSPQDLFDYLKSLTQQEDEPQPEVFLRKELDDKSSDDQSDPKSAALKQFLQ